MQRRILVNIWSVGDEVSYIPSKFVKIVVKLPAELMRTVQPAFAVYKQDTETVKDKSDSPYSA